MRARNLWNLSNYSFGARFSKSILKKKDSINGEENNENENVFYHFFGEVFAFVRLDLLSVDSIGSGDSYSSNHINPSIRYQIYINIFLKSSNFFERALQAPIQVSFFRY